MSESIALMWYHVEVKDGMVLEINGETRSVPLLANVGDLLQFLGVGLDRIAVELNHKIVRRQNWDDTPLGNMDKVEIVQFVGGG